MALQSKSLFLYGYQVSESNRSIDFQNSSGGPEIRATLTIGYYSLSSLLVEIKRAMQDADGVNSYTVTADRTIAGGTQNRVSIISSGSYLSLNFASGTRSGSTACLLFGFNKIDRTGALTYTGNFSSGTVVVPDYFAHEFLPPEFYRKNQGSVNIATSGIKEAIVFNTMKFWQARFKYIPYAKVLSEWMPLMTWMSLQRLVEFTPEISAPNTFYNGTLESSADDSKGFGYKFTEQLPGLAGLYDSGLMKFRVTE